MKYVFALCVLLFSLPSEAEELVGPARVVDGDTLMFGDRKVHLYGVDAPELAQTCKTRKGSDMQCGELARQALGYLVRGVQVRCESRDKTPANEMIGVCHVGWLNINEEIALEGWAIATRDITEDYVRAETFAKARKEGIWKTEFIPPWEWRNP